MTDRDLYNFAASGYSPYGRTSPEIGDTSSVVAERVFQEIADNVQLFANNVTTIERKTMLLNTAQDSPRLRADIIQLVRDTTQLARFGDGSIRKLRQQNRRLSPGEKLHFDRLMNTFSSSGTKFQKLQKVTAGLEQDMLTRARGDSMSRKDASSISSYPEEDREDAPLAEYDSAARAAQMQQFAEQEEDAVLVEQREREMRQLEHDILDINDIFRDMGAIVNEQGEMIDNIEANVEVAATRVETGNKQLEKAVSHKRCSRKLTLCIVCILVTVLIVVIIAILIALKIFTPVYDK